MDMAQWGCALQLKLSVNDCSSRERQRFAPSAANSVPLALVLTSCFTLFSSGTVIILLVPYGQLSTWRFVEQELCFGGRDSWR